MQKIKFLKNFSSPVFGNVWMGRVVSLKSKEAQKYINMDWAELVEEAKSEKVKKAYKKKVKKDGDSKPQRSEKSSKGRSK